MKSIWFAVDKDGTEYMYLSIPYIAGDMWQPTVEGDCMELPFGSIYKILGHHLVWNSKPIELRMVGE